MTFLKQLELWVTFDHWWGRFENMLSKFLSLSPTPMTSFSSIPQTATLTYLHNMHRSLIANDSRGGVLKLFLWRGVQPKGSETVTHLEVYFSLKNMADLTGFFSFRNFLKSSPIFFSASKTAGLPGFFWVFFFVILGEMRPYSKDLFALYLVPMLTVKSVNQFMRLVRLNLL